MDVKSINIKAQATQFLINLIILIWESQENCPESIKNAVADVYVHEHMEKCFSQLSHFEFIECTALITSCVIVMCYRYHKTCDNPEYCAIFSDSMEKYINNLLDSLREIASLNDAKREEVMTAFHSKILKDSNVV